MYYDIVKVNIVKDQYEYLHLIILLCYLYNASIVISIQIFNIN